MKTNFERIDALRAGEALCHADWVALLSSDVQADFDYARTIAHALTQAHFGRRIFIRGLIEFTNICKQDCYYCGIRRSNPKVSRYRMEQASILAACAQGYALGCRTFVLQGGEDAYWDDARMCALVAAIAAQHPDCAITLSLGERSRASYEALFQAGARRYLLRHETADGAHFAQLHPPQQQLSTRLRALRSLKDIGYQTGCGMMIGSPGQSAETLACDMEFIAELQPEMVGVGPFLPHEDTPFRAEAAGSVPRSLFVLSLLRIMRPKLLLPATTALGTAQQDGRLCGIEAGCNVLMPNITPQDMRHHYQLYNGKLGTQDCPEDSIALLRTQLATIGYEMTVDRGDYREEEVVS